MKWYLILIVTLFALALPVLAQDAPADDPSEDVKTARKRAASAAKVFDSMMGKADRAIPQTILDKAEAVIIVPGVIRAAFGVGGRGGRGIVSRRTANGWSEPAFIKIGGGSYGLQIGVTKTDYILLVMNESGLNGLMTDGFELGGEAGAVAGPIGREAGASTNPTVNAELLSYSKSRGLYAGVALKGIRIYADNNLNQKVYTKNSSDILGDARGKPISQISSHVRVVPQTLAKHSRTKR
jgi:SH3 domain-containing YSC84-like protein 1